MNKIINSLVNDASQDKGDNVHLLNHNIKSMKNYTNKLCGMLQFLIDIENVKDFYVITYGMSNFHLALANCIFFSILCPWNVS